MNAIHGWSDISGFRDPGRRPREAGSGIVTADDKKQVRSEKSHDDGKNPSSLFGLHLTLVLLQYRAY
jgi:hypothetical protein